MLDLTKAGAWDGVLRAIKVVLWVAFSGAIVAVAAYFRGLNIPVDDVITVAWVGAINAILAGLVKWVTTKAETSVKK